ncbi:MAG: peptidase M16 [Rhodomicrobium sp.]|nr:MAG: peptidase M16 [Rhodomicrobium sp.]
MKAYGRKGWLTGLFIASFLTLQAVMALQAGEAQAMKVERVISPGGIEAWLVEEHNVPLISMQFGFKGGATQDADGREGTAYLLSGMLDEGAGELTSTAFQEKVEDLTVRMGFEASRDHFSGKFQTLSERRDEGFDLLKLALTKPRFDQDAIDRVRRQIVSSLKFEATNPQNVATRAWFKSAYGEHPYARPTKGTEESQAVLTRDDLLAAHKKIFAREHLKIAVVGDITAEELGPLLDRVFGELPEKSGIEEIAEAKPVYGPETSRIEMAVPQSVIQFGHQAVKRSDDDFIPAYIINYILGGGGFNSRLMEEVREKRGLAYSIYSYLYPLEKSSLVLGGVATKTASVDEAMSLIRQEFTRMADEGPSVDELKYAKDYLTGSYALRFDTSSKIASQLLWIQVEGLGMDYIEQRNDMIDAVTTEQIKIVAKRLLDGERLRFVVVGQAADEAPKTQ